MQRCLICVRRTVARHARRSYRFGGSKKDAACLMDHTGPGWTDRWFEADGYGDSVEVRRLRTVEGGFVVKFKRAEPFRAQRHIVSCPRR